MLMSDSKNSDFASTSTTAVRTVRLWRCTACKFCNFVESPTCDACFSKRPPQCPVLVIRKPLTGAQKYGELLTNKSESIAKRMRMCFHLKALNTIEAIKELNQGFRCESALLKHEIAYVMGQMGNRYAIRYLNTVLSDDEQQCIVRHEAAEALAAIGDLTEESLRLLNYYADDKNADTVDESIRSTSKLALKSHAFCLKHYLTNCNELLQLDGHQILVESECLQSTQKQKEKQKRKSKFNSVDPAPPFMPNEHTLDELRAIFLNNNNTNHTQSEKSHSLFERYRAMFTLRDMASNTDANDECIRILCAGFADPCSLFKHEIAFVLGQIMNPSALESLVSVLKNESEVGMVRHESAEAIGNIVGENDHQILEYVQSLSNNNHNTLKNAKKSQSNAATVVSQSCEVAVDMYNFWHTNNSDS